MNNANWVIIYVDIFGHEWVLEKYSCTYEQAEDELNDIIAIFGGYGDVVPM